MILTQCPECQKLFYVYPSELRKSPNKCCSKKCYKQRRSRLFKGKGNPHWQSRPKRNCKFCGRLLGREIRLVCQFCSRECADKYHSHYICGINNPRWKGGPPKWICQICGREFRRHISREALEKGYGKYCSLQCRGIAHQGERNPAWNGGTSFEPYPETFNNAFKEKIRTRDGYTCALCGEFGNQVHHIDYIKEHTVENNCITLCTTCHGKTNYHRNYWELKLSQIVASC